MEEELKERIKVLEEKNKLLSQQVNKYKELLNKLKEQMESALDGNIENEINSKSKEQRIVDLLRTTGKRQ